jgi:hypothetical protein
MIMEKDYCCDKCEIEMTISEVGILSSLTDDCDFTTKLICLCKPCTIQREKELKQELQLIQYAIKQNIKNR